MNPGTSAPAVRAAAFSNRPTRAPPGTSCAKACPKAISAASAWRSRPAIINRVYAIVEARNHTALFRSDDAGDSWAEVNNSLNVSGRPFYFARVIVDPKNRRPRL